MYSKLTVLWCCFAFFMTAEISAEAISPPPCTLDFIVSKGKQQKLFPKIMIDRKVFFGMKQDKFLAKNPAVTLTDSGFDFRRTYTEKIQTGPVEEIMYYFTTTENPVLYEFIIKYRDMQSVQATATQLLGNPNHKNTEWRISNKEIKEDFNIGVWTFGHKIVYAATLEGCEWEKGFES